MQHIFEDDSSKHKYIAWKNTSLIYLYYVMTPLPYREININTLSSHMVEPKFSQLHMSLKRKK